MTDFYAAGLDAEREAQWGISAVDAAKEVQALKLRQRAVTHCYHRSCLTNPRL